MFSEYLHEFRYRLLRMHSEENHTGSAENSNVSVKNSVCHVFEVFLSLFVENI